MLHIDSEAHGDIRVIRASGSIDALTAPDLGDAIEAEIQHGNHRLVIDLAGADYISSAGLRSLLGGVKSARREGGDLRLAGPNEEVMKVLDLSGFTSILKCFGDVESAVASMP